MTRRRRKRKLPAKSERKIFRSKNVADEDLDSAIKSTYQRMMYLKSRKKQVQMARGKAKKDIEDMPKVPRGMHFRTTKKENVSEAQKIDTLRHFFGYWFRTGRSIEVSYETRKKLMENAAKNFISYHNSLINASRKFGNLQDIERIDKLVKGSDIIEEE